uniref:glycerophosphodiester phosphodiesterase n=1 Tax=Leersia perrieri TaxID=77586 RepID=A0A0D9X175_9ORYZ
MAPSPRGGDLRRLLLLAAAALVFYCGGVEAARPMAKAALQTDRAYNIAHRGSNGELPEETAAAYERAIEEGADFIEADVTATRDGHLVCFHDVTLDATTDVADRREFAARRRTLEVQWQNVTGFFINESSRIITFDEFITIAQTANRIIGIYPEMKNPVFINKQVHWPDGKKFEDKFIAALKRRGYGGKHNSATWKSNPIFIQSFAPTSLIYASVLTDSPKIFLVDDLTVRTEDTSQTYSEVTSDEFLDYMREHVVGVGPWKDTVVPPTRDNKLAAPTDLVARAHARGLQVHPYTFRNENRFLHFNFRQDPYAEYDYWVNEVGVDGLFTDFPASLRRYQEWTAAGRKG